MKNLHDNQLLILIEGILNGGKTLVYNIIRKEDNFIYLDFSKWHYTMYRDVMEEQIGKENMDRLEPFIKYEEIFHDFKTLLREVGYLMKQFPDKNFVIKPVNIGFSKMHKERHYEWTKSVVKYLPIKLYNLHFLFIIRHPKLSWYTLNHEDTNNFISSWYRKDIDKIVEYVNIVKVEELEKNKFLRSIITKTDLKNFVPFTDFDYYKCKTKNFDNIGEQMKEIEEKLSYIYKLFNYDLEDKNADLFIEDRKNRKEVYIADEVFD